MENRAYYREIGVIDNNFCNDRIHLQVNCAGQSEYDSDIRGNSVRHDFYLMYIYQGEIKISNPQMNNPFLRSGDVIIFDAGHPFDYFKPKDKKLIYYWVHFTGVGAKNLILQCGLIPNKIFHAGHNESIITKFMGIFESFMIRDAFFDLDGAHNLTALCITLGRYISGSNIDNLNKNHMRLKDSIKYIHENLSSQISLKQLAEIEFMSISRYRTIFTQTLNMPPKDYITMLRLNRACELLRKTNSKINEIAAESGYADEHYFSRVFSKNFSISPGNYRKIGFYEN